MRMRNAECGMRNEKEEEKSQVSNLATQKTTRREIIKLAAGAVIVPPSFQAKTQARKPRPSPRRFFTLEEFAMVDELSDLIIPTDEHSPGARAAKVAEYIDQRLAEAWEEEAKQEWREGLKLIDRISNEMSNRPFMQASPEQRVALLERIAQNEANPQKPEEKFFILLKSQVAYAYYTSKIGIHDELEYKGNTYLREFAGEDVSKK
jgi:Gluconate 2-dehydrogenase subunit 3